jgi:N-acetylglucosaminyl-diphospho-decaprenol L-rhamnosyltransferase
VLSVVTVLHDSAAEVARLLDSLERHLPQAQVVAVDTGSTDGGPELARERGAEVVLGAGPGFGAANNAGVARAKHPRTALLNPDVELLDAGLAALDPPPGTLLAPRLLLADGRVQDSVHPAPGTVAEVLRAPRPARPWLARRPRPVGWAIAAALVARTETLRALGPFDPEAFLFYEDLDLCLRAGGVVFRPDVTLLHTGGHSVDRLPDRLEQEAARRRHVVEQRLGTRARCLDDLAQGLTFALRAPLRPRARAQLAALRVARRA